MNVHNALIKNLGGTSCADVYELIVKLDLVNYFTFLRDLLIDSRRAAQPGSDESVPQETNRTGRRRGHRRSQPSGKTVRRYEKADETASGHGRRRKNARVLADSAVCLAR